MSKEVVTPRDSGSSGGPKTGALSVEADEIVSGSDTPPIKDGRGMSGTAPKPSPRDSGSSGGPKEGRGMAKR